MGITKEELKRLRNQSVLNGEAKMSIRTFSIICDLAIESLERRELKPMSRDEAEILLGSSKPFEPGGTGF